jgi:hypothetical protein
MKRMGLMMTLICLQSGAVLFAAEKAPQKIVDFANTTLVQWGQDPIIVKAVKDQNAQGLSIEKIKEIDQQWLNTPGIDAFMTSLMESEAGKHLRDLQKSKTFYAEIFVMDNQGANVAMSNKTSDYWQGDEAKFKESYKEGAGAIYIDDIKFDDSTQTYLVQVSVPVKDGDQVIGALTVGIEVDKF